MRKALSLFLLLASTVALGYQAAHGIRSPRGLLMGDAYTAANSDEYTLFYNPASMGRHQNDITFYPFNPTLTGTNVLTDSKKYENFPSTPQGVATTFMNQPLHAGVNITPGFKLFNLGFSLIASESADVLLRNKIHPVLDIDYRSDRGFVFGGSIPIGPGRLGGKKALSGQQTSIGFGAKYIKRRGLYDTISLTGTDVLDNIGSDSKVDDVIKKLGIAEGDTWGFDGGLEHVIRSGPQQMVFGLSALDIGNSDFKVNKSDAGKAIAPNKGQVNLGAAWMMRTALFKGTFSMDVRGLNQQMDTLQRLRLGTELGTPIISFLGGWNAGYLSYGLALNLGFSKITAGFYGVEAGSSYQQTESKRLVIYFSLFDFSFDA